MADLQVSLYQHQELQVQQLQERGRLETAMMRQIMDERVRDYETQSSCNSSNWCLFHDCSHDGSYLVVVLAVLVAGAHTDGRRNDHSLLALTSSPTRPWHPQTVFRTKPPSTNTTSSTPLAEWMSRTESSPTTTTTTTTLSLPPPYLLSSPPSKQVSVPHPGRATDDHDLLLLHNRPFFEERAERCNRLRRRRQSVESFMRAQVQHIRQRNWGDSSSSIVESMAGHQSLPTLLLLPHEQP